MKSGNLNLLEPSGPLQACNRTVVVGFLDKGGKLRCPNIKCITEMLSQLLWKIYMGGWEGKQSIYPIFHPCKSNKYKNYMPQCQEMRPASQSPALNPASFKYKIYNTQCNCLASKPVCCMMKSMYEAYSKSKGR